MSIKDIALISIFMLGGSVQAYARPTIIGHNLTPTTSVLGANDLTIGTYAAAYGVTDELSVGTSTWLDYSYSMPNVGLKYAPSISSDVHSLMFEGLYFKTAAYGERLFDQASYFLRASYGLATSSWHTAYVSSGYQYFFNDRRAYSLRMVPQTSDPTTWSLTTLQVLSPTDYFAWVFEFGMLGLNYPVPFWHYGASINLRSDRWMFQIGLSASRSKEKISYEVDENGRIYCSGTSRFITGYDFVTIFHPEIQIQYLL